MTTQRRGSNAGIGKAGKPARADRAAQADAAREDEPLDEAGRTPDPGEGQVPCDKATAAPDPSNAYERVLKRMTFAGASLEPDGLHPYDIAARGLRLILTAPEGSELANLREAFTPLAPLPFHVMVRAMELDWREREKGWRPNRPVVSRRFSELCNRGDTIGQMVARLVLLLPCYEVSPDSERGADPGLAPLDYLLYLLAVDVWRHPDCLALPPLAALEASSPDLQKMEDDDHERGFFRGVVGDHTEESLGDIERISRYRTEDPTSWLQFVQPQWWLAAERLRVWLMENLKAANADRSTLDALVQNGALAVLLTGLLESTFDDSDVARSFAVRVFGDIPGCLEALIAVGAATVPVESDLDAKSKAFIAQDPPPADLCRARRVGVNISDEGNDWLQRFVALPEIRTAGGENVAAALKRHGVHVTAPTVRKARP